MTARSQLLDPRGMSRPDMIESLRYAADCLANGPLNMATAKAFAATLNAHAETLAGASVPDPITMQYDLTQQQPVVESALAWWAMCCEDNSDAAELSEAETRLQSACEKYVQAVVK